MLRRLIEKWRGRKVYKSYGEKPTWLLILLLTASAPCALFYGDVLKQAWPVYKNAVDTVRFVDWGVSAWLLTTLLVWLVVATFHFGQVTLRCTTVLRERLYP